MKTEIINDKNNHKIQKVQYDKNNDIKQLIKFAKALQFTLKMDIYISGKKYYCSFF